MVDQPLAFFQSFEETTGFIDNENRARSISTVISPNIILWEISMWAFENLMVGLSDL